MMLANGPTTDDVISMDCMVQLHGLNDIVYGVVVPVFYDFAYSMITNRVCYCFLLSFGTTGF